MSSFTFTEVVRLAQIGVGGWGRNVLRNLAGLPSAEIVVLCDDDEDTLAASSRLSPDARTTTRIETVLADAAVDAVVVHGGDAPWATARASLEAGKHVLVTPPLASRLEDARALVDLADAHEARLMVGHTLRYHPALVHLEERRDAGDLGAVRTVSWHLGDLAGSSSASVLDRLGPSALSVTQSLLDDTPRAVSAHGQRYTPDGGDDVVLMTIAYRNGGLAHLHLSRVEAAKTRRLSVVGSRGAAVFDDLHPAEPLRLYAREADAESSPGLDYAHAARVRGGDIQIPRLAATEPLLLQCREFVASIRERRAPLTDGHDGVAVARLLEAASRSLEADGAPVDVES